MPYLFLALTVLSDVFGTTFLKMSEGFTLPLPSFGVVLFQTITYYSFSEALKSIDMGCAYATWTSAGVALIAIAGMILFKEKVSLVKILSLICIIIGVIGINTI